MQQILKKYQEEIEKLNVFEKQTLKNLINYSSYNGMSRFFIAFAAEGQSIAVNNQTSTPPFKKT
jgi:hypothetical protein